jgi:hypothetical protein
MKHRFLALPMVLGLLTATVGAEVSAIATAPVAQAVQIHAASPKAWPGATSRNWSGYAGVTSGGNKVTYTSARWKVPTVNSIPGYSSTWVGIDGYNNSSLIQTGTEQDYVHGQFIYRAWWEMLPASETIIASVTISPGDTIDAFVQNPSGTSWKISLTNVTTGQSFTTTQTYNGPGTSAEWVQEAPTGPKGVLKLAHYSQTQFSNIQLGLNSGAPANLALIYPGEAIAMVKGNKQISTPSKPTGNSFNVAYGKKQPPAP